MKNFFKIFFILVLVGFVVFSCIKDEIDVEVLMDFVFGIVFIFLANNSKIVVGNFDLKVIVVDGEFLFFVEIFVQLLDEFGNIFVDVIQVVMGICDSIVVLGVDFVVFVEQFGVGIYSMNIMVLDVKGQIIN